MHVPVQRTLSAARHVQPGWTTAQRPLPPRSLSGGPLSGICLLDPGSDILDHHGTAVAAPQATLARRLPCTESAGWNLEQGSWLDSHIWWSRKVLAWNDDDGQDTYGSEWS